MRLKPFILPFLLVVLAALPVVLADRGDRAPR